MKRHSLWFLILILLTLVSKRVDGNGSSMRRHGDVVLIVGQSPTNYNGNEMDQMITLMNYVRQEPSLFVPSQYHFHIKWKQRQANVTMKIKKATLYPARWIDLEIYDRKHKHQLNLDMTLNFQTHSGYISLVQVTETPSITGQHQGMGTWLVKLSNYIFYQTGITFSKLSDASAFRCYPKRNTNSSVGNHEPNSKFYASSRLIRMSQGKYNSWYHQFGYQGTNDTVLRHSMMKLDAYPISKFYQQCFATFFSAIGHETKNQIAWPHGTSADSFFGINNFGIEKECEDCKTVGNMIHDMWEKQKCWEIQVLTDWIELGFMSDKRYFGQYDGLKLWHHVETASEILQNINQQNMF